MFLRLTILYSSVPDNYKKPGVFFYITISEFLRLVLRKMDANTTEWHDILSAGGPSSGGGSNVALLDLEVGDHAAVWVVDGTLLSDSTSASFSGYRIIKK